MGGSFSLALATSALNSFCASLVSVQASSSNHLCVSKSNQSMAKCLLALPVPIEIIGYFFTLLKESSANSQCLVQLLLSFLNAFINYSSEN